MRLVSKCWPLSGERAWGDSQQCSIDDWPKRDGNIVGSDDVACGDSQLGRWVSKSRPRRGETIWVIGFT